VTPKVLKWLKTAYHSSVGFEIKASSGNSIPASALEDHQIQALLDAESDTGLIHKISDESRRRKPMDGFLLKRAISVVVACFPKWGVCHVIPVQNWNGARFDMKGTKIIEL
jgi:hypothetical protein